MSRLSDGQSMNARINGSTTAPNGTIIRHDSHGDNPAFLQMNQNGKTATSATIVPRRRMTIISGVPRGPIEASKRFWIFMMVNFAFGPNASDQATVSGNGDGTTDSVRAVCLHPFCLALVKTRVEKSVKRLC